MTLSAGCGLLLDLDSRDLPTDAGGVSDASSDARAAAVVDGASTDAVVPTGAPFVAGSFTIDTTGYIAGETLGLFALTPDRAIAPGTLLIALVTARVAASVGITGPTDWMIVRREGADDASGAPLSQVVAWHIAGASEPASYDWTFSAGTLVGAVGMLLVVSGADTSSPIEASSGRWTGDAFYFAAPSVDVAASTDVVVGAFGASADARLFGPPALQDLAFISNAAMPCELWVGAALWSAGGPTGEQPATDASGTTNGSSIGQLIVLRSAP